MCKDRSPVSGMPPPGFETMSLLENLPDAVIILDETGKIQYVNAKATTMVGINQYEIIGKTLLQGAPHLVTTRLYQAIVQATKTHIPFQVEYRSPITRAWLRAYLSPTNEGIALFFHEEMEPIPLEDSICQREGESLNFLEHIAEQVAFLTPEGLILDINQQLLTDAQIQREEVIGTPCCQLPLWLSDPVVQEQLRAAIAHTKQGNTVHFEVRVHPSAGRYLDLALTLTPHYDVNQQVEYLIYAGWDITKHKQLEKEVYALIETIPNFVWLAGPDGKVTYNNPRLIAYLAIPLEQIKGDGWMEFVHPEDRQRAQEIWLTAVHTGRPYEVEYRLQNGTSGKYCWFLARGLPIRDDRNRILSWIGTCTDINELKQAEERLKASEQNWRILAETVPQLVWTVQPDNYVDYTNQRYHNLTRVDIKRVGDDQWRQTVHPEDIERTLALWQRALETGELYENEYRLRDGLTGEYRWFLTRALPVYDDTGQINKWFGTSTDISEQKRTEKALRQSQEQTQFLMNSNVIGIIFTEGEKILRANDLFLHMTGYSREDLEQGRLNWMHMTAPEYIEVTQQARQQLEHLKYVVPYEKEYICKDGSHLPVIVGSTMTQHCSFQTICFVLDNSARKESEQRKDNFLSMASHELKTPITSLRLQAQMLKKQLAKSDLSKADASLSRMEKQLNVITRLVNELFDLSKIQAGKLEYVQEIVNLNELLQEIVEAMEQAQTTHTIVVSGPTDPILLVGDRDRLGQVFLNLISNAIKYSPEANRVDVDIVASADAFMISVRDQGIGIPQEQREKIFERFYRAVPQHQHNFPGLGMGLSIVLEIVKHYEGTITVKSEKGRGSTFQVTLPRASL